MVPTLPPGPERSPRGLHPYPADSFEYFIGRHRSGQFIMQMRVPSRQRGAGARAESGARLVAETPAFVIFFFGH